MRNKKGAPSRWRLFLFNSESGLHLCVTLDAVVNVEGVLAFAVTGAAGLALFHVSHAGFGPAYAEGEDLCVAVVAFVGLQMELVAEGGIAGRLRDHVVDLARFHAFVASAAVAGGGEDILAVVAGSARFPLGHVIHGGFADQGLVGECSGVAVLAGICCGMDVVAEGGRGYALDVEDYILGLHAFVALGAVPAGGEYVLAVVTGAARLPFVHIIHGGFADDSLVGEELCVAFLAAVSRSMDGMAEGRGCGALDVENDILGLHSFVAAVAVGGNGKGAFAVVAGTACPAFFHLGHGHGFFFAGDDFAVMAASAGTAGFGNVRGVAEGRFTKPFDLVRHVTRLAFMAFHAVLFSRDAEGFHPGVAGAAALCLFHLGHGVMLAAPQVEDGIMADLAVVFVCYEMG